MHGAEKFRALLYLPFTVFNEILQKSFFKLLVSIIAYKSRNPVALPGVDPDSDEEADDADPGLGNEGDSENADTGSKVRQMVTSAPGPLLTNT